MRELARRIAVLVVLSAAGIGLLAPVATRSATPIDVHTVQLLEAAQPATASLPRTLLAGRERSAALTLAHVRKRVTTEALVAATPPAAPARVAITARFAPIPTPRPAPVAAPPPLRGSTVSGKATYYCCSLGYRGQAVVALPGALGGHYDPPPAARYVTVCADRCVSLPVVDYCGCHWGTASQKVADLSPEAWAAVTDRSRSLGVVQVTIHLG
ncbi:MAG TPA: hypothetical protein VFX74_07275 [Candidatus Limnocylindria bacterium]|nr:hypothetical protein [Candidatus Limnocylindria bacterium]